VIDLPCQTCTKHKRCADERTLSRLALFAYGKGEACPTCPLYREATWRGLDIPCRALPIRDKVFGLVRSPHPFSGR
jgi:hypothetical protein